MKILLVSATAGEVSLMAKHFGCTLSEIDIVSDFTYRNHQIRIVVTGMGVMPTAFHTGIHAGDVQLAINAGIAGSYHSHLKPGSLVNVSSDTIAGLGAERIGELELFKDLGILYTTQAGFSVQQQAIINKNPFQHPILQDVPEVKGLTVNTVSGNQSTIALMHKLYNADVETMEGAAFLFSCNMMNLPCVQLRAVSNYVQPAGMGAWNIPFAISKLNQFLVQFIEQL